MATATGGSGTLTIESSIIAGNLNAGAGSDSLADISVPDGTSISHCLIGDSTGTDLVEAPLGAPDANGNLIGGPSYGVINPKLGLPAANGGLTETAALMGGSPAIDAGANPANLISDQRGPGFPRVFGNQADIGAFEQSDTTPPSVTIDRAAGQSIRPTPRRSTSR